MLLWLPPIRGEVVVRKVLVPESFSSLNLKCSGVWLGGSQGIKLVLKQTGYMSTFGGTLD